MIRAVVAAFLLSAIVMIVYAAVDSAASRPGNLRGYDTDILLDTFGFNQEEMDVEMDAVFQGCSHRD